MNKKILIIGSNGFISFNFFKCLYNQNAKKMINADNISGQIRENLQYLRKVIKVYLNENKFTKKIISVF